jgi:hypothetical protein
MAGIQPFMNTFREVAMILLDLAFVVRRRIEGEPKFSLFF